MRKQHEVIYCDACGCRITEKNKFVPSDRKKKLFTIHMGECFRKAIQVNGGLQFSDSYGVISGPRLNDFCGLCNDHIVEFIGELEQETELEK